MKRLNIAQKVSKATGLPIADVERVIVESNKAIIEGLGRGESVFMRTFGTYGIKVRKAKTGNDFRNNRRVHLPEKTVVFFKPSPFFSSAVNDIPATEEDIKQIIKKDWINDGESQ